MVKAMHDELGITVPVALHLDHGTYEGCYKCIKAGFTSIMFDGSHYPIDENVAKTKELVSVAHATGHVYRVLKLVQSVARKTELLEWASALILTSARELLILV